LIFFDNFSTLHFVLIALSTDRIFAIVLILMNYLGES